MFNPSDFDNDNMDMSGDDRDNYNDFLDSLDIDDDFDGIENLYDEDNGGYVGDGMFEDIDYPSDYDEHADAEADAYHSQFDY